MAGASSSHLISATHLELKWKLVPRGVESNPSALRISPINPPSLWPPNQPSTPPICYKGHQRPKLSDLESILPESGKFKGINLVQQVHATVLNGLLITNRP